MEPEARTRRAGKWIPLLLALLASSHGPAPCPAADDEMRLAGYLQGDFRGAEGEHPLLDGFLVRRARIEANGTWSGVFRFRLEGDFARSTENLQQGWVEFAPSEPVNLRVGQFKVPYALERLVSGKYLDFSEPSLAGLNFHSFIDTGLQFHGALAGERFGYALSLLNGEGRLQGNRNQELQYGGRLTARPFTRDGEARIGRLHLGVSAHREGAGQAAFNRSVTALGTTFLQLADSLSVAGARTRWGAEIQYARGPVSLTGEYLELRQDGLERGGAVEDLRQRGGYAAVTWLVTGEEKVPGSAVDPSRPVRRGGGGFGALELALRYDRMDTDDEMLAAGFAEGTSRVEGVTGGVRLWPTWQTRLVLDVYHHRFDTPIAVQGISLESETGVIARFQIAYQATVLGE